MKSRTIKVDYLARVEGEGALSVKIKGRQVTDVKLRIFEPPRFFEAFLRGRKFSEAPDITARICGICPIAYQMSACHAIEDALRSQDERADPRAAAAASTAANGSRAMRCTSICCTRPISSVTRTPSAWRKDHPDEVKRGLRLKKAGNEIVSLLGGREIHPINVRVGGFYKVPTRQDFAALAEELKWARDAALETVRWVATFTFPDFDRDYEFVALRHPDEYPFNEGRLVSNKGLDIAVREYDQHFVEEHVPHSNALQSRLKERDAYFVGPQARYNLNFDKLSPLAQEAARERWSWSRCAAIPSKASSCAAWRCYMPAMRRCASSISMRCRTNPAVDVEAARRHRLRLHRSAARNLAITATASTTAGCILDAKIVPPTSQNQKTIEDDLWQFVQANLVIPKDKLQWQCEQAVRNYDPCISCATHFLKLHIEAE